MIAAFAVIEAENKPRSILLYPIIHASPLFGRRAPDLGRRYRDSAPHEPAGVIFLDTV